MREYEIGSEAWLRDRLEHGLDPAEGDLWQDDRVRVEAELFGRPTLQLGAVLGLDERPDLARPA